MSLEMRVERGRLLQEHLVAFEGVGLPVIHVQYGNFSAAVDTLHEYVLQCIQLSMAWLVQEEGETRERTSSIPDPASALS